MLFDNRIVDRQSLNALLAHVLLLGNFILGILTSCLHKINTIFQQTDNIMCNASSIDPARDKQLGGKTIILQRASFMMLTTLYVTMSFFMSLLTMETANAAELGSGTVEKLAIYEANVNTSDELPDDEVVYNVIDPDTINSILAGIELSVERNCLELEAANTSYMYVKFKDGTRKVYHLFLLDSHLALKDQRHTCFFIEESSRSLIISIKQGRSEVCI